MHFIYSHIIVYILYDRVIKQDVHVYYTTLYQRKRNICFDGFVIIYTQYTTIYIYIVIVYYIVLARELRVELYECALSRYGGGGFGHSVVLGI